MKIKLLSAKRILTKKKPEKGLLLSLKRNAGRSSTGRITIRHRGGGVKKLYRIVDFGQEKLGIQGKVIALEYDPYRTAYLALVEYQNGDKRYILAAYNLNVGEQIICADKADIKNGNRVKLKNVPVGTQVFNVELEPGTGGKMVRGAGTAAKVLAYEDPYTLLEMPSKEVRKVPGDCFATVGQVSHPEKRFENVGRAGSNRLRGWRPTVRGSAMNPPDHPHGGGEGRTPIGMKAPKTPWGKFFRGIKTRNKKKWTSKLIVKRRK